MRNYRTVILFAALSAAIASCQNDDDAPSIRESNAVSATIGGDITTRTSLNGTMKVVWDAGDKIKMYGEDAPQGVVFQTANSKTATAIFTPEVETANVTAAVRYAVYPASAVEDKGISGGSLDIDFSTLSSRPYITALNESSDISAFPMFSRSTSNAFTFSNLFGGVIFQISAYQGFDLSAASFSVSATGGESICGVGSIDLESGQLTLPKTGEAAAIVCSGLSLSTGGDPSKSVAIIAFLPAVTYSEGLTFTLTDSDGRKIVKSTSGAFTVNPGVVTRLKPIVLTYYYGQENCYLSSGAGTISIDVTPYVSFSEDFLRDGVPATSAAGTAVNPAQSASVLWQMPQMDSEGQDVVSAAVIEGNTLKVTTTGVKGNAVVAIKDVAGTILWSYHIWVSEEADLTYGDGSVMMDRNLGATSTTPASQDAFGLFYQWGRKDPLPRKLGVPHPSSKAEGGLPAYGSVSHPALSSVQKSADIGTVAYTVQHPADLIYSASNKACWHNVPVAAFWGRKEGGDVKTVYDPCPEGYRVPGNAPYEYLVGRSENAVAAIKSTCATNLGYLFTVADGVTSYFPLCGILGPVNTSENYTAAAVGYMIMVEYRGYCWTNGSNGTAGNALYYNNSSITLKTDTTYGMENSRGLRCQKIK